MKIRDVHEAGGDRRGECILLVGQAGAGKTPLAASIARSRFATPCLAIDIEGGLRSVEDEPNLHFVEPKNWEQITKVIDDLGRQKGAGFKGIIFDNLGEAQKMNLKHYSGDSQPEFKEYWETTRDMTDLVRDLRDLAWRNGLVCCIVAWDMDEEIKGASFTKTTMAMTPMARHTIPGLVDTIGHITATGDSKETRKLTFRANSVKTIAKMRRSQKARASKLPLEVSFDINHLPMPDVLEVLMGGGEWPTAKYAQQQPSAVPAAPAATPNPAG